MKNHGKHITKLFVVLLAFALILPTLNDIKINAASAMCTVYTVGFESGKDGWGAHYGGSVSLSSEKSYTGSYSLKMTNRTKAWHSQGKNIYSAKFGKGNSRTKWVAAYTCNYLNESIYPYDELKKKMEGANIVLGFSTKCYLTTEQTNRFATLLDAGYSVIDAWMESSKAQAKVMSKRTVAAAMYVEEAYNDTIYSYYHDAGTYRTEDIKIKNAVIREN